MIPLLFVCLASLGRRIGVLGVFKSRWVKVEYICLDLISVVVCLLSYSGSLSFQDDEDVLNYVLLSLKSRSDYSHTCRQL